jgi:hypothetical protein
VSAAPSWRISSPITCSIRGLKRWSKRIVEGRSPSIAMPIRARCRAYSPCPAAAAGERSSAPPGGEDAAWALRQTGGEARGATRDLRVAGLLVLLGPLAQRGDDAHSDNPGETVPVEAPTGQGVGAHPEGEGTPLHPLDHVLCQTAGAHPLLWSVLPSRTRAEVPAQGDPDTMEVAQPPESTALDELGAVSTRPADASAATGAA